jgi:fructan beta-fructosidase
MQCFFAMVVFSCAISSAADDIILGDFEDGTYNGWTVEGAAFGSGPATGKIGPQRDVKGFKGKGLVNTFLNGDKSQGVLTSPEFTVNRRCLTFLVGGGYWKNQTEVRVYVDGEMIDVKRGKNSDNLNATAIDLRKYQGQMAQIKIWDKVDRGWGHVLADHFVLTDKYPKGVRMPNTRQLYIEGQYLLIPIDNSDLDLGQAPMLRITMGDILLYKGKGFLADSEDKISWWAHLPVPEAVGKTVTLEYSQELESQALKLIDSSNEMRTKLPLYKEALRPQLRFSQRFGWNNDPNGMLYYDGEYHLFFQSNPLGIKWANMFWGHAVSKDLVHWEERPFALRPWAEDHIKMPASMSAGMCFSGGGAVDFNNTLGLQQGDTKTLFVTFTAKGGGGERIATSTDKGESWKVGKVLFNHPGRDPKPLWHRPSQQWVIAVYNDQQDRGGKNISFYTSPDLEAWSFQSAVPGFFECPELFELPVDTDPNNTRWVLMGADAKYLVGQFDGKVFIPEHDEKKETVVGKIMDAIYAGQCFSDTPDGRVIYIGWAGMTREADKAMPFHNGFTVPIHLTLVSSPDGPRLNAVPVKECDQLRNGVAFSAKGKSLGEANTRLSCKAPVQEYDVVVKLTSPNKDGKATLRLGQTEIAVDVTEGSADIRVICDRPFMEVITGGGERYKLINRKDRGQPLGEIALERVAGTVDVDAFTVYKMKSIWR